MTSENQVPMTPEEILALAQERGVELTDAQMESIAGGDVWEEDEYVVTCSSCGKKFSYPESQGVPTHCPYCGHRFSFA